MLLDWLPHSRQGSHLINSNAPHMLQTREQKPREEERERDAHGEKACVPCMLLLSVKAGRQMGAVRRRLDGGRKAETGV